MIQKITLLFILIPCLLSAQIRLTQDTELEKQIIESGLLHHPLPLDINRSYEAIGLKKQVVNKETIAGKWELEFPTFTGKRAKGSPSDPDYATYGSHSVEIRIDQTNWEKYNRIRFDIYPDCDGTRVVNMNLTIVNDAPPKKGFNRQSGSHLINLVNKQWNHCFLDIDEYQRDNIMRIQFSATNKGKDLTMGDMFRYRIENIELQLVEDPEIVSGWTPGKKRIVYSTCGYNLNGIKTAIAHPELGKQGDPFSLVDASTGKTLYSGKVNKSKSTIGEFLILDFSDFKQSGEYKLQLNRSETRTFSINEAIWENSLWRTLNFVFCQRCGHPVPGIHNTCHIDLCSVHNGEMISYGGGWHDAGDLSQQTLQTGDITYTLLEAYTKVKDKNPLLAARLMEEAQWGLEFILKNRYGDGYRASSVGLLIWQDGKFHSPDDIQTVRVQNLAFDNFLYSAYEAYAAMLLEHDPMMQEYLLRVAKEDFDFAMQRHKEVGFGEFIYHYEHGFNTSESQYMATISWAASMLYKLTKDTEYARLASEYIRYTLDCQRKEPLNNPTGIRGFFYRDKSRQSIVHYIHQSREQVYMQAILALCETQPEHPDFNQWAEAIRLHGEYIKSLMPYTAPYGMIPSGVYHIEEWKDTKGFYNLHIFAPQNATDLYVEQVQKGISLDKEHYIKRFPVWFNIFNGNTAIHLSMGKSAALCGKFLHDTELLNIAQEQLYWTVGKNPFGQSLIYGEGYNYPQMDSFSSGEITGEMPVGIRTLDNEDIPYWPQTNNACYKEVWVTSAGKWISLATEFY